MQRIKPASEKEKHVRRFIPKKTSLSLIKNTDIYSMKNMLNIIPGKDNRFLSVQKIIDVAPLDLSSPAPNNIDNIIHLHYTEKA